MPPPTTLVITLQPNSVANVVNVPISAALGTLETTGQGLAADIAVRNIFKAHVFTADGRTWFNAWQVISITAQ
jgi:hypothetical protein